MYAIVFDLDEAKLAKLYNDNRLNDAYADIHRFLTKRGFERKQSGTYFGDATIDAVRCVTVVRHLADTYDWFAPTLNEIRMLRVEDNNDLLQALNEDDKD